MTAQGLFVRFQSGFSCAADRRRPCISAHEIPTKV